MFCRCSGNSTCTLPEKFVSFLSFLSVPETLCCGVVKLKKVSEEYTAAIGIFKTSEVSIKKMEKQHALYIRDSSKIDEIDMIIEKLFGELYHPGHEPN